MIMLNNLFYTSYLSILLLLHASKEWYLKLFICCTLFAMLAYSVNIYSVIACFIDNTCDGEDTPAPEINGDGARPNNDPNTGTCQPWLGKLQLYYFKELCMHWCSIIRSYTLQNFSANHY